MKIENYVQNALSVGGSKQQQMEFQDAQHQQEQELHLCHVCSCQRNEVQHFLYECVRSSLFVYADVAANYTILHT